MKIHELGEFGLLERIREKYPGTSRMVLQGIGDDTASLCPPLGNAILVTTDTLVEDVHFTRKLTVPYLLGMKSLAVSLSDVAAMGGIPRFFLLSIGIPPDLSLRFVDLFYEGVAHLAEDYDVALVGGDLTASSKLVITGVVVGDCPPDQVVYRHGARPGDDIFVTGPLGDSALGLEILRQRGLRSGDFGPRGEARGRDRDLLDLIRHHLAPTPRVIPGRKIAELGCATAMIDISDGLVADLGHILEESRVGASIQVDEIPRSLAFERWAPRYYPRPIDLALVGGEDYELLFTAPGDALRGLLDRPQKGGFPIHRIGHVTSKRKEVRLLMENGKPYSLSHKGYDHFQGPAGRPR